VLEKKKKEREEGVENTAYTTVLFAAINFQV
jgi:hypothetical protein